MRSQIQYGIFCTKYDRNFHNKSNLNQHMNSVHSKEKDDEMDNYNESHSYSYNDDGEQDIEDFVVNIWDVIKPKRECTNSNLKIVYKDFVC